MNNRLFGFHWQTANGETYPLNRIRDDHLVNIFAHVYYYRPCSETAKIIKNECLRRGFLPEFLKGAPYPYFDPIEKVWKKWSFETDRDEVV